MLQDDTCAAAGFLERPQCPEASWQVRRACAVATAAAVQQKQSALIHDCDCEMICCVCTSWAAVKWYMHQLED